MADAKQILNQPVSTITPLQTSFQPVPDAMIAGVPSPQPAAVRLAMWNRAAINNPIFKLFSKSPDSTSQT